MILSCGVLPRPRRIASAIRATKTVAPSSSTTSGTRRVGIDVAFWFMEDARYTTELIRQAPGRRAGAGPDGSARQRQLSAERVAPQRAADRGHPDAQAADQLHPPLEDDAVPRPERRRVQRRQLQRRCLASGDCRPLRELHRRGHLLHRATRPSSTASGRSSTITGSTRRTGPTTPTSRSRWSGATRSCPKDPSLNFPPAENYRDRRS